MAWIDTKVERLRREKQSILNSIPILVEEIEQTEGKPIPRVSRERFIQAVQEGHMQRLKQQYGLDGSLTHFIRFNNSEGQDQPNQGQSQDQIKRSDKETKAYQEYRHFMRRLNFELKHRQGIGWFGDNYVK